jgi:pyridoxamine 5'-phosphate oxidase family protein
MQTGRLQLKKVKQPDVTPVGFDFDGDYFYVGGMNILKSTKYKNVLKIIRLRLSLMI